MKVARTSTRATACTVLALMLMPATGCGFPSGRDQPDPVVVGVSLPLTGAQSQLGVIYHNALQLQVEQTNQRGLTGDRRLKLLVRDNRSDPAAAAETLARLAANPQVAVIVTAGCPGCVVDAAPDLTLPVISLDPEEEVAVPADQRHWVFKLGPNPGDNADRISQEIAAQGADTVGVIAVDDPYGRAGVRQVADAAARDELGIAIRQNVSSDGEPQAVTAAATTVAAWRPGDRPTSFGPPSVPPDPATQDGPDAVVIWARQPLAGGIASALRSAGYDGPLYLDSLGAFNLFPAGESSASYHGASLVFTDTPVVDRLTATSPHVAERQRWFRAYLSRYGSYHLPASWAGDAIIVTADALNRAVDEGSTNRATLRDKIETTRINALTGLIRYTAAQHSGLHPTSLRLLSNDGNRWSLAT